MCYHFFGKGNQKYQMTAIFGKRPQFYVFKMTCPLKQLWRYVIFLSIFFTKITKKTCGGKLGINETICCRFYVEKKHAM